MPQSDFDLGTVTSVLGDFTPGAIVPGAFFNGPPPPGTPPPNRRRRRPRRARTTVRGASSIVVVAPTPAPPPASVSLSVSWGLSDAPAFTGAVTATLQALGANGAPSELFLCLAAPLGPGGAPTAPPLFQKICTVLDVHQYPAGAPVPWTAPPWFRSNTVTLYFRSRAQATACVQLIQAQLAAFVTEINYLNDTSTVVPKVIGVVPSVNVEWIN